MHFMGRISIVGLIFNILCGAGYILVGAMSRSWWMLTIGAYYCILSMMRFFVVCIRKREHLLRKLTGILLMVMSLPLAGTVILAVVKDRGIKFNQIVMIAIAVYAFAKISLATVQIIKSQRQRSVRNVTIRSISFADACVSIFSLQRSMLASFDGMSGEEIIIFNAVTGSAVCVIVFMIGILLMKRIKVDECPH